MLSEQSLVGRTRVESLGLMGCLTLGSVQVLLVRARALYKRFINSTGYVGDRQWAMIKMVEQGVVLYPVVFFFCWGPGRRRRPTCTRWQGLSLCTSPEM